ncbi:MAG TPA: alpha,alpha-trehalase TreF [Sphingomonas sp.]|nr:alpha,alpha-trehalase TreF [Sphingomonas sp.]HMI19667.1 alpha,alpha-trehalase TreF [Sphingomonas sp.]
MAGTTLKTPLIALALAAVSGVGATASAVPPAAAARADAAPQDLYGPLFEAVQLERVFPDSKTFVDMIPRETPAAIMQAYAREKPAGRAALAAFVAHHFAVANEVHPNPTMREHIRALWPILGKPPIAPPPGSSALTLPAASIVPGGRYQEFYYWDTYFTMLGLKADSQQPMIDSMLANFMSLIERYGHIPNGTRTYYLSRSQPPYFALMLDLSDDRDPALARRRLAALKAEHAYWMAGTACLGRAEACQHVVRMPDGSLLNRYWDARDTPRDESFAEDRATAAAAARPPAEVDRDLRAAAESGWDFGSRWLADGRTLASIHTTDIVPIDLNSLMWNMEMSIARRCAALGDQACARDFTHRAETRRAAIFKYLWTAKGDRFADYDRASRGPTSVISAALLEPLFVGLATPEQARATARLTEARLLAPGGLRTSLVRTGQQWDSPNGWAPLQWIAITGLDRYGEKALARDIATRWLNNVGAFYKQTGRMIEKYDVEERAAGGGGEYAVQDGFGWTNGVTAALMDRYGYDDRATAPQR